ncbi:MAG: MMPL family transporter, partial [Desulforhabdus sp.]|nr:MMPL family transporter [Desulforhabdus sp.]
MNPVQFLLKRILVIVTWRPALTVILAFALAILSTLYTARNLDFETSQRDLISPEHHLVKLAETIDQFDDVDNFIVTIENSNTSRALDFLRVLISKLESDKEHIAGVFYRIDPNELRRWALLYPDHKDLLTLRNKLQEHQDFIRDLASSPQLTNFFQLINNEIASAMVGELFTGFLKDENGKDEEEPFDLSFLISSLNSIDHFLNGEAFKSPWGSLFADGSWEEETEGYFWTENKRYLLVFVTPVEKGEGFNNAQESLEALRAIVAEVRSQMPDVQAGVTGREAMNVDEMTSSFEDMSVATMISLVGLAFLLTIFWKGVRRPLFQMTNSVTSLVLTFGLTTLVVGHLNILSIVFAPMMVGLGDDYGVHWLSRYREEVKGSRSSRREAIQATMVKLGPGIILAGITAALSFFPLVLTGFKGLAELGIISAMGMIVTTITTLIVLPPLTLMFDRPKPQEQITHVDNRALFAMS